MRLTASRDPDGGVRAKAQVGAPDAPPGTTEWAGECHPGHLLKQNKGDCTPGTRVSAASRVLSLRHLTVITAARLAHDVESNPGPSARGRRSRGEERRRRRRERRRNRRRAARGPGPGGEAVRVVRGGCERVIVTWNVQGLSLRESNRERLLRVIERVRLNDWEIVCLTELRAESSGVLWLGEGVDGVAIVHSQRVAVVMRGEALRLWRDEGQQKWMEERVVAVVFGGLRVVSAYQPIWGTNEDEFERYRRDLGRQVAYGGGNRLVIGGDFNMSVGKGNAREGVCGRYGVGRMNEQGRDFVEWCEENELVWVNSYMKHRRRGTWFSARYHRWYELDGFVLRKRDRTSMVRRMCGASEWGLSDHRPKCMRVRVCKTRWRAVREERRVPRVMHERLGDEGVREEYERKTRERMMNLLWEGESDEWGKLAEVMVGAASEACGEGSGRASNPWMVGREEELQALNQEVNIATERRNECAVRVGNRRRLRVRANDENRRRVERELEEAKVRLREAKRELRRSLNRWETEWWDRVIEECSEACEEGKMGKMYKALNELGRRGMKAQEGTNVTVGEFKEHFQRVSCERYEIDPGVIEEVVAGTKDLRGTAEAVLGNEGMNARIERGEIECAIKEIRESAPGKDGVRIGYIRYASEDVKDRVVGLVQRMFEEGPGGWEESLRKGVMVPLHKKGDRNDRNNYRGVCLLAMGSRILARILAKRLGKWAERLGLMDDNQSGFRTGRSTGDAAQVLIRMQEDVDDYRRRLGDRYEEVRQSDRWPEARLLDLRKAYPRVSKPALWGLLERCGLSGKALETIYGLHETTVYQVRGRGREGFSEEWVPARGLREGCATSPVLFNIFHQAVMRQAEEARCREEEVGVGWRWVPGGSFAGTGNWEKECSEAKEVRVRLVLFADDTTIVGEKGELGRGVERMKEVMGRWEEKNNEDKEEKVEFGTEEGGKIRILGSWIGGGEDVSNRLKRAGGLWWKVKAKLKGSRLSRRWQARIVEACVESALLFDCGVRVWYKREFKQLQKFMDKCYRYVWSNRREQPLRRMQELHVNMWDVRSMLGVKSVRWKVEKRVYERIGHVMRMNDERIVKAVVLGWYEGLIGESKMAGRKKKTVLYWKWLLKEAGIDWTDIERRTKDRKEWKRSVRERMERVHVWEKQRGHRYAWSDGEERVQRSECVVVEEAEGGGFMCRYEGCGKVCKSGGGRTIHEKRMHRVSEARVIFVCDLCGCEFVTEGNRKAHRWTCTGGGSTESSRQCGICGGWVSKPNYARHVRRCGGSGSVSVGRGSGESSGGGRGPCPQCGTMLSVANMARHLRSCRRVWDPGGEPRP